MASYYVKNRTNHKYQYKNKDKNTSTNNHSSSSHDWRIQRNNKKTSRATEEINPDDVILFEQKNNSNNVYSLKLSNLPNNTKRMEIKDITDNLNVRSFHIPKSKNKGRSLKHAFINFWCENDMKFAKNNNSD